MLLQSEELFSLLIFRYETIAESFNKPEFKSDARNFHGATLLICSKYCPAVPYCKCLKSQRCSPRLHPAQAALGLANLNSQRERRRKKRLEFRSFVLQFHRHITQTRPRRSSPTVLLKWEAAARAGDPGKAGGSSMLMVPERSEPWSTITKHTFWATYPKLIVQPRKPALT